MARWIVTWSFAWLALYPLNEFVIFQDPVPLAGSEARLRARVAEYGQAMKQGDGIKLSGFINSGQRDAFRRVKKTRALSYTIDKITLDENCTRAQVEMTVKKPVARFPPIDIKIHNTWEWIDGEWFVVFKRSGSR